jgi:hypothetical protein
MASSSDRRLIRSAYALEGEAEVLRRLYAYWAERCGGRRMPRRQDIDPAELKECLPDLILVDMEGRDDLGRGRFRYRVVGTREAEVRGQDPTGRLVQEGYIGPSAQDALDCYETVCRERCALLDPLPFVTPDNLWSHEDTLFLPLSEDGETVSQILVCALKRPRELTATWPPLR